jgi:vitamin B12 transporter
MAEAQGDADIAEITVRATRIANTRPAGSYPSPATALRFDLLTELQSRGLPEGQADVTVRGGIFENTGFSVGAVTVMDPQTGHYTAGLPVDPATLSAPERLTDIDNAIGGFNSAVGTIRYSILPVTGGGALVVGAGSDSLQVHSLRAATVRAGAQGGTTAAALSAASSRGDGSLPNGDHDFERYNLHLQRRDNHRQSDLLLAYQDKFYGWPGAYTGFATFAETDHSKTTLLLANHRQELESGWIELGAYYRRLVDDYDFDRSTHESGVPGAFEHETAVHALGFEGLHRGGRIDWRYGAQVTVDELVASTDLTHADFDSRRYFKVGILPSVDFLPSPGSIVTLRFGATLDGSNRDSEVLSPLLGVSYSRSNAGRSTSFGIEYSQTSQVPGYTALASPPSGLFGGNAALGREKARQLAVNAGVGGADWQARVTLFYRSDHDLVDWTYSQGAPFARQANALDDDVTGLEVLFRHEWANLSLAGGYAWMDKDAKYRTAAVDASFYALNYARHRATLAATWRMTERLEWRLDSEYRVQEGNPLRASDDSAAIVSLGVAWEAADGEGPGVTLTVDNLTDDDYQQFPGTPAVGRQISLMLRYGW